MVPINSLLAFLTGLVVRLAIPILVTVILIFLLRRLDARWQLDAQTHSPPVEKPQCWKIKGCSPEQIKHCEASTSSVPCWQTFRLPNGYLQEKCLGCSVFIDAPIPAFNVEPRRM